MATETLKDPKGPLNIIVSCHHIISTYDFMSDSIMEVNAFWAAMARYDLRSGHEAEHFKEVV